MALREVLKFSSVTHVDLVDIDEEDVIIIDLPDPNDESLNKLYTNVFYRLVGNHLTDSGVFVAQSTSPYYAGKAYWCINKTIASEGFSVIPYHLEVPSFGDWGFQIASARTPSPDSSNIPKDARYYSKETFGIMQFFGKYETVDLGTLELNTVFKPVLLGYYQEAVQNF